MSKVPLCKDSLGWMFSRLDTNFDLQLDQSELSSLSSEKSDVCTKAFLRSCDPDRDRLVSSQEWCSCFQRYQGKLQPNSYMFLRLTSVNINLHGASIIKFMRSDEDKFMVVWVCDPHVVSYITWIINKFILN